MGAELFFDFIEEDDKTDNDRLIIIKLNDKLMPIGRGEVYEDPLDEFLELNGYGEVTGGGTMQLESGEIKYCDIEVMLNASEIDKSVIQTIISKLEELGAPKGSQILVNKTEEEIDFGKKEGLAIYIDGVGLPDEVYQTCDINFVMTEIRKMIGNEVDIDRYWNGQTETAIYYYGNSFKDMKNAVADFVNTYPLLKRARIKQIA